MSTNELKVAWSKVGNELEGLGLKLKYHVEQEFGDDDEGDDGGVKGALNRLGEAFEDAVEAAEHAAKDQAVREDLRATGRELVAALTTTVDQAVKGVRSFSQQD
jgi:hypothetical protein